MGITTLDIGELLATVGEPVEPARPMLCARCGHDWDWHVGLIKHGSEFGLDAMCCIREGCQCMDWEYT